MRTSAGLAAAILVAMPLAVRAQDTSGAEHPAAEQRVEALLARMTLDQKLSLLGGVNIFYVPGLPDLGLPRLGTADGPFGVRAAEPSTVYPGGIGLAATWNPVLVEGVGRQIGRDARARGKHFHLAPGVNLYRSPLNGRNFEYFGEDPYLAARTAVAFIQGVQSQGVSSTVKHWVGNNSEFMRHTSDSRIDERALRELYLPAFEAAVREADVGAVMAAYNRTNGERMTEHERLNLDVLKGEWGFDGVLMSDWGATHDALAAATGGLDLEMPGPAHMHPDTLRRFLEAGRLTEAAIDDKVRRLLRTGIRFGWPDRPQVDPGIPHRNPAGRVVALEAALEGMVLLKNAGATLPLDDGIRRVAVIGPNADPTPVVGGGSASVMPIEPVSFLDGVTERLGADRVTHHPGLPTLKAAARATPFTTPDGVPGLRADVFEGMALEGEPTSTRIDSFVDLGEPLDLAAIFSNPAGANLLALMPTGPISVRWTGIYTPEAAGVHDFFVQQGRFGGSGARLFVDGEKVADTWDAATEVVSRASVELDAAPHEVVLEYRFEGAFGGPFVRMGAVPRGEWTDPEAERLAAGADAVVLAVGFDATTETEGWDRTFGLPPGQDELIRRIAAANPRTVVVLTSGGAVDMRPWLDRVPAVLQAWYPGELGGTALARLLLGDATPSGHLPATFERRWEDNPTHGSYHTEPDSRRIVYDEGVLVGYRGFEASGTEPLFPFGHGLSYTTFAFTDLAIREAPGVGVPGDVRWQVSFDVTNTGDRAGAAVAQLYVADPEARVRRPPKELKGFRKVVLEPGETKRVAIYLDGRSLAYRDVDAGAWRADAGVFRVLVGPSSARIELTGELRLDEGITF